MERMTVKELTKMAMVTAIVFLATYAIKIPVPNGYTHLGDCMIFIGVIMIGRKNGAIAGASGAALADFIGGYAQWVFPTFWIKFLMATVMGLFVEKIMPSKKNSWLIGCVFGGLVQIIGYTFVDVLYYGFFSAILGIPSISLQTLVGIGITTVFVSVFKNRGLFKNTAYFRG